MMVDGCMFIDEDGGSHGLANSNGSRKSARDQDAINRFTKMSYVKYPA